MTQTTYEVWAGFDIDELELIRTFETEKEAFASAENLYDAYDIVEIIEDCN
jgi:hypothetical protein